MRAAATFGPREGRFPRAPRRIAHVLGVADSLAEDTPDPVQLARGELASARAKWQVRGPPTGPRRRGTALADVDVWEVWWH